MKSHLPFYVLAGVILMVGVVGFGVPVSGLWVLVFVLCPLMMMFMMRGMHGGDGHGGNGHLDGHSSGDLIEDRDRTSRLGIDRLASTDPKITRFPVSAAAQRSGPRFLTRK